MSSRWIILAGMVLVTATGCTVPWNQTSTTPLTIADPTQAFQDSVADLGNTLELESQVQNLFAEADQASSDFVYPIANYTTARTKKVFGQYIAPDSGDRFSGYHTGDDIEVADVAAPAPVYALTSATLVQKQTISGYGGVVILEFVDQTVTYHALYGHVNLSSVTAAVGDTVVGGAQLGVLGDDQSDQTDGERKHLHFGLYEYSGTELYAGYVADDADLANWVNPSDWLRDQAAVDSAA